MVKTRKMSAFARDPAITEAEIEHERWLAIPSAPEYQVSSLGRVRSFKWGYPKILRYDRNESGYMRVKIHAAGSARIRYVHGLVLEAFVGQRPAGMEVCHFPDPNPENCRLANLRYGTSLDNSDDRRRHGTIVRGSKHHKAKTTYFCVTLMRWLNAEHGVSKVALADWFGLKASAVGYAVRGDSWQLASKNCVM